ncbi:MAG TPA: thiamine-phosphate kinase [Lapillicoccus sp.]|nr:thiamine-phosphate kinase [Lapillicoccus sp.]
MARGDDVGRTVADIGEDALLAMVFPILAAAGESPDVTVGPGDDAAVLALGGGGLVATTDAVVQGRDWRDEWSTGVDVGAKVAAQNLADIAAMGARPVALLVTLVMASSTPLDWVLDLARGLATAGCPVVGGDLSSAPEGVLTVSVTALGSLDGRAPVLRSGARVGDTVAVAGTLGLSEAGLRLLAAGRADEDPEAVAVHRRPVPPLALGPAAAEAGATAMIDLSDGLLRDASRVAAASGVGLALATAALDADVSRLAGLFDADAVLDCVLGGGEEHSLLATFPASRSVPDGFRVLGRVVEGKGVSLDGAPQQPRGWDHFGG